MLESIKVTRKHLLGVALGVAASLLVFGLYVQPDFMVMLSEQLWACF